MRELAVATLLLLNSAMLSWGAPPVAPPSAPVSGLAASAAQPKPGGEGGLDPLPAGGRFATAQLLDRDPDQIAPRLVRALAAYHGAQPLQALADLDYALERAESSSGRALRALVHLELGNHAEALADAREAAGAPDLPIVNWAASLLVAGRVLLAPGQGVDAAAYFERAATAPDETTARLARMGLKLLAATPPADGRTLALRDGGGSFQALLQPSRSVRFQHENGVAPEAAAGLARLLDARLAAIGLATGATYSGSVELIVYKSEWDLERAIGGAYRGPGRSRALRQGVRVGDGPWRQHVHSAITNPSLLFDLTHEAVHLSQAEVGLDDALAVVPAWLIEGHAEHVAATTLAAIAPQSVGFRYAQRGGAVETAAREGQLLDLGALDRPRDWARAQARNADQTYGQSLYAVTLLDERHGMGAPLTMVHGVLGGAPFSNVFHSVTGTSPNAFYADALEYTRQQAAAGNQ